VGLVLVTLVLAVLVGRVLGGRIERLGRVPYRGLPLLGGAALAYLAGWSLPLLGLPARWIYAAGLAVASALAVAFCLRTSALYGAGLMGAGLLANAVMVAVNGGMPVSAAAVARAGLSLPAALSDPRQVLAGPGTALRVLGAVVPVPLPVRPEVASVGDLLALAGLAQLVVTAMLPRRAVRLALPTTYTRGIRREQATETHATEASGDGRDVRRYAGCTGAAKQDEPPSRGLPPGLPAPRPAPADGTGHVRVLSPRPRPEGEPLPRAGPT
jgi:hypothetical protein